MTNIYKLSSIASVIALAACSVGPDYQKPNVSLTPAYMGAAALAPATSAPSTDWWKSFGDADLDRVIERVSAQNLDLAQAHARVQQERSIARRAGAELLPTFDGVSSASAQHASIESPIGKVANGVGAPRDYQDYALGTEASWELDFAGGLRRGKEAAAYEAQAAEVSYAGLQISIRAEAADVYLSLRGFQARVLLAQEQEKTEAHLVDLIQLRVDQGVSPDRELKRSIGELERVRATIPPLLAKIDEQLNRLDVLMGAQSGTYRAELEAFTSQPATPVPSGSAAPGELLRHRPDIVIAERHLAAANARIGAAISGYYPRVSLGGIVGVDGVDTSSLFKGDAFEAQGIVGLRWRLFDFGRVDAEVAQARGREAEALAAYRNSVLRATEDVETALSRLVQDRIETVTLERQIAALTSARNQTQIAYEGGVLGLIDVLDADRELLAASDQLAMTRAESARAAVASYRALGGGWPG